MSWRLKKTLKAAKKVLVRMKKYLMPVFANRLLFSIANFEKEKENNSNTYYMYLYCHDLSHLQHMCYCLKQDDMMSFRNRIAYAIQAGKLLNLDSSNARGMFHINADTLFWFVAL